MGRERATPGAAARTWCGVRPSACVCSLLSLPTEATGLAAPTCKLALYYCAREGLSARAFGQAEPASVSIAVERPGLDIDSEITGLSSQVGRLKQVRVRKEFSVSQKERAGGVGLLPYSFRALSLCSVTFVTVLLCGVC